MPSLFGEIRQGCAFVAQQAEHVFLQEENLAAYAASLSLELNPPVYDTVHHYMGSDDATLAYILILDSINFGSGYFPYMKKRTGMSGYFTVASCLKDYFLKRGVPSPEALQHLSAHDCQAIFEQESAGVIDELMLLFANALNALGAYLLNDFDGEYKNLIKEANGSAERLARLLARIPYFQDETVYKNRSIPLYKRAQITASDLALAFDNEGYGYFKDLDKLTIFADNLVPHVLRLDGLLVYKDELLEKLVRGELLKAGSAEELEIRAVAVYAVECLAAELAKLGKSVPPRQLDILLWDKGQADSYRKQSRHRTRTVFY